MTGLLVGVGLFMAAFLIHLALWRIRLPRRQTRTMLILFPALLGAGLYVLGGHPHWFSSHDMYPLDEWSMAQSAALYIALMLAYITTYSALEVDSPSLVMVREVFGAGAEGISAEQFTSAMSAGLLIEPRIRDLLRDGMAVKDAQGRLALTCKGRRIAWIFNAYRKLSGIDGAGG